ncbi:MAG: type II secretion system F family protein [Ilumatobacteraceae bacterium]
MIRVMLYGGLIGVGIWITAYPRRLKTFLGISGRIGLQGRTWLNRRTGDRHRPDLAIMHRVAADMVVRKLIGSLCGVATVVGALTFGAEFGMVVPLAGTFIVTAVAAVAGFILPDQLLRASATKRRRNFLHAFSSYLDLTNVLLAGGAGTETALIAAADAGDGWAFDEVRSALIRARSARRSPWIELASLGQRFKLPEIIEVAGSVQLAGEHGARIRSSLAAKADSLRYRQMGEIEAQAQASTERMGIPMVVLFISFIALIGYPAVTTVVGGL